MKWESRGAVARTNFNQAISAREWASVSSDFVL